MTNDVAPIGPAAAVAMCSELRTNSGREQACKHQTHLSFRKGCQGLNLALHSHHFPWACSCYHRSVFRIQAAIHFNDLVHQLLEAADLGQNNHHCQLRAHCLSDASSLMLLNQSIYHIDLWPSTYPSSMVSGSDLVLWLDESESKSEDEPCLATWSSHSHVSRCDSNIVMVSIGSSFHWLKWSVYDWSFAGLLG